MKVGEKTKEQLINELVELRQRTAELETSAAERKRMEEALEQAAEEWGATFDSIVDLVWIGSKDSKIVRVNKAFADTFKMEPKELIGKTCCEIVHGTKEPWPNCPFKQTLQTKRPNRAAFFEPHLGVYLDVSISPIFDEKGEVAGGVHVAKDVTERKRAEEIRISEERLKTLFELAPDGIFLCDLEGNPIDSNKALEELSGYKKEEVVGKNILELNILPPEQVQKVAAGLAKNVLWQPTGPDEFALNRKDGTQVPVEIRTW